MPDPLENVILESLPAVFRAAQEADPHRTIVAMRRFVAHLRDVSPATAEKLNAELFGGKSTRRADLLRRADPVNAPPLERESNVPLLRPVSPRVEVAPCLPDAETRLLDDFVTELQAGDRLLRGGLCARSTLLLIGPPGVGKTLIASSLAERLQLPLLQVELATAISSYLGRTGQNVKEVLDYARSHRVVLLLDEFDAIAKRRDDHSDLGELKRIVSVLLKELEDWTGPSVIVAATNHEQLIDPAVFRRFDLTLRIPPPDSRRASDILRAHLAPEQVSPKVSQFAGELLAGVSGSDVRALAHDVRRARLLGEEKSAEGLLLERLAARCESVEARKRFCALATPVLPEKERTVSRIAALFGVAKSTAHSYIAAREGAA
ncbi:MAG: ATP-binding protein [Polyangiaceae bacterium]|jgi:SpoVK/Ycf46/Vps4 family AAA+-type ATPase